MKAGVRRQLEMAARVRVFSRAHPFSDTGYTSVAARFEGRMLRVDALVEQERAGHLTSRAANQRKRELRRLLQSRLLRHLSIVGELAGREMPELAGRFRLPAGNVSYQVFHTAARGMVAEADAAKGVLANFGLTDDILEELIRSVEEIERVAEDAKKGHLAHVGARADLRAVTREVVELVHVLDGINQFRFRHDPELVAAWESATSVVGPSKKATEPADVGPGEVATTA